MTRLIADMRNLGPATARWLKDVGVTDENELRAMGSVAAYNRLKFVFGKRVSIIALYAIEAALIGCDWRALDAGHKARLRDAARQPRSIDRMPDDASQH